MKSRILILGGTTEAYVLAQRLAASDRLHVVSSLAGRTPNPRLPAGETRIGGFGGVDGLVSYLRAERIDAVIDATHPFASRMGWNASEGCRMALVPLLRLERPAWIATPQDRWTLVACWEQALTELIRGGSQRVFLAVGRQELAPFAQQDGIWFLIRVVSAPDPKPHFPSAEWRLARGPFSLEEERALLADHAIDTIVCKNSGGEATAAKLVAARERGIRILMLQRPARPATPTAATVEETLTWLDGVRR